VPTPRSRRRYNLRGVSLLKREFTLRGIFARIKIQDVAVVTRQLATLLGAGLPLIEALSATIEQADIIPLKRVLADVRDRVNEGSSLADAMAEHPRAFSELYVNMVRAGEASGAMEVVLQRLADFMDNQVSIRPHSGPT
jgi:general secretion pathway protein F